MPANVEPVRVSYVHVQYFGTRVPEISVLIFAEVSVLSKSCRLEDGANLVFIVTDRIVIRSSPFQRTRVSSSAEYSSSRSGGRSVHHPIGHQLHVHGWVRWL